MAADFSVNPGWAGVELSPGFRLPFLHVCTESRQRAIERRQSQRNETIEHRAKLAKRRHRNAERRKKRRKKRKVYKMEKKRYGREYARKKVFPYVYKQWVDLDEEKMRQQHRLEKRNGTTFLLNNMCTLYRSCDKITGNTCPVCEIQYKQFEENSLEVPSQQLKRMQRSADALRWRRRKREKKLGFSSGELLQDYTRSGGAVVDPDMRAAIDQSFVTFKLNKKKFSARLSTRKFLKFPQLSGRGDAEADAA